MQVTKNWNSKTIGNKVILLFNEYSSIWNGDNFIDVTINIIFLNINPVITSFIFCFKIKLGPNGLDIIVSW